MIGSAPTLVAALPLLKAKQPDAVIVAGIDEAATVVFGFLLATYSDLPIICTDPSADSVQVITSQRVEAHLSDLLAGCYFSLAKTWLVYCVARKPEKLEW